MTPDSEPAMSHAGERDRNLGMWCHLAALLGVVFPGAVLVEIVGPLVVWLVNRDESPLADRQGAEAVNFQITMNLLYLACLPLVFVFLIGIPLLWTLKLLNLVLIVVAAVRVKRGEEFRYPFNLRLVRPRGA